MKRILTTCLITLGALIALSYWLPLEDKAKDSNLAERLVELQEARKKRLIQEFKKQNPHLRNANVQVSFGADGNPYVAVVPKAK